MFGLHFQGLNMKVFVNTGFANVHRSSSFHSEIDTQAVLWEELDVLDEHNDFYNITTEDGYQGWINRNQVIPRLSVIKTNFRLLTRRNVIFYEEQDVCSQPVRDSSAGASVPVYHEEGGWLLTRFPDNQWGWLQHDAILPLPALSREGLISAAMRYRGVPYVWGGKTGSGLDCSGFVQLIHKLFGMSIRRDAWMQFEDSWPVSHHPFDGETGDLIFFSENRQRITHVGFCLGNGKVLHARGLVRVNSLRFDDPLYSESLFHSFVEIRTTFGETTAGNEKV